MSILFWVALTALAYAHVGYPLLMLCWGRRRQTPASAESPLPFVSLVIPAYNEAGVLRAKLDNSLRIDYPPNQFEIIVANDGSTDETADIARDFESLGVRL